MATCRGVFGLQVRRLSKLPMQKTSSRQVTVCWAVHLNTSLSTCAQRGRRSRSVLPSLPSMQLHAESSKPRLLMRTRSECLAIRALSALMLPLRKRARPRRTKPHSLNTSSALALLCVLVFSGTVAVRITTCSLQYLNMCASARRTRNASAKFSYRATRKLMLCRK